MTYTENHLPSDTVRHTPPATALRTLGHLRDTYRNHRYSSRPEHQHACCCVGCTWPKSCERHTGGTYRVQKHPSFCSHLECTTYRLDFPGAKLEGTLINPLTLRECTIAVLNPGSEAESQRVPWVPWLCSHSSLSRMNPKYPVLPEAGSTVSSFRFSTFPKLRPLLPVTRWLEASEATTLRSS